jgi:hypothetical protein
MKTRLTRAFEDLSRTSDFRNFAVISAGFVSTATFLWLTLASLSLRPIADDYCHADVAFSQQFGAVLYWMENWSGDVLGILVITLFVGAPLAFLPIGFGSAATFAASTLAVGFFTMGLLRLFQFPYRAVPYFLTSMAVGVTWNMSLWTGAQARFETLEQLRPTSFAALANYNTMYAEASLHWQTVNAQYVIYPLVMTFAIVIIVRQLQQPQVWPLFALALWGFAIGGNPQLGLTSLVIVPLVIFVVRGNLERSKKILGTGLFVIATIAGLSFGMNTPGALIRRTYLPEPDYTEAIFGAIMAIPQTFLHWLSSAVSVHTVSALLLGSLFAFLPLNPKDVGKFKDGKTSRNAIIVLFATSIIIFLVNSLLEQLTYVAYWHTVTARVFLFTGFSMLGFSLMRWVVVKLPLQAKQSMTNSIASVSLTILLVTWVVGAVNIDSSLKKRLADWTKGDATISAAADISSPWVLECAKSVGNPYWLEFDNRYRSVSK